MGINELCGLKIYRDIYVKDYNKFPYQKLSGRKTLLYSGKIICGIKDLPSSFDKNKDLYINCDCDFPNWKNLKRVL